MAGREKKFFKYWGFPPAFQMLRCLRECKDNFYWATSLCTLRCIVIKILFQVSCENIAVQSLLLLSILLATKATTTIKSMRKGSWNDWDSPLKKVFFMHSQLWIANWKSNFLGIAEFLSALFRLFCESKLKMRYYGRYVDDFFCICCADTVPSRYSPTL